MQEVDLQVLEQVGSVDLIKSFITCNKTFNVSRHLARKPHVSLLRKLLPQFKILIFVIEVNMYPRFADLSLCKPTKADSIQASRIDLDVLSEGL